MNPLEEQEIQCPHCGEIVSVLIDCTVSEGIEDCFVCCRPMLIIVHLHERDDDASLTFTLDVVPTE